MFVLLGTSIIYNCVLATSSPFCEYYNMILHYVNEFSFFFFMAMCMTFTDFVTDLHTRQKTGTLLSTFMFLVLIANVTVCIIAFVLKYKFLCVKR